MIQLVVGLGNPGKEYERTRHNAGFWLVETLRAGERLRPAQGPEVQGAGRAKNAGGAWFLLPQTFMNVSGQPVQMLAGFFKIKPEEMLVVHDELDFAPGTARLKQGGGIAGHNGLKDISQRLASHDYWRLRIGIGQPRDRHLKARTTCCRSPPLKSAPRSTRQSTSPSRSCRSPRRRHADGDEQAAHRGTQESGTEGGRT